jgi:hypothetical protein
MIRVLVAGIAGFLLGLLAFFIQGRGPSSASAPAIGERKLALLAEENERLRKLVEESERTRRHAAEKVIRDEIERAVEEIRGLKFKEPVDYNILSRSEIKDVISGKLRDVYSDEEFAQVGAALGRLGLLPEGYPLRQAYVDLMGEQIAAFYDQHAHKLFMFEDATLDNQQNRVVLAHELTHALQDQHFSLKQLPLEIKTNDDRAMAASALVEGDATLVMNEYMMRNFSLQGLKDSVTTTLTQDMAQLQKAPRFLRELLVFPYLRGLEFSSALFAGGGYDAISRAYANPPTSSAQILDPSKYLGTPLEPVTIDWADTALKGEKPTVDNVVGEFALRLLIAEWAPQLPAEEIANGWRGDRYLSYRLGETLIWQSVWADENEAAEFARAQQAVLEKRYGPAEAQAADRPYSRETPRAVRLLQAGAKVTLIDAASVQEANALLAQFAAGE